ncbi:PepSY domain-containing protein [Candidatus Woesearchaeota archaeon]|nr:PepSY domain-containing protein [Candidatus Woesearchaeota archaeon]
MLKFPVAVEKLESTEEHKQFKVKNKDSYLVSGFFMSNASVAEAAFWQIDYFDPHKERITSFLVKDIIEVREEQEVLHSGEELQRLNSEEVALSHEEALEIVLRELKGEKVHRTIFIIQQLHSQPTWNITLIFDSFQLLNVRIHAATGKVIQSRKESLMSFRSRH